MHHLHEEHIETARVVSSFPAEGVRVVVDGSMRAKSK